MAFRRRGRRPARRAASQRKYTWVVVAAPLTSLTPGQSIYFELLSPVRPATDITQEVYQNMTNPTVIAVYGHVTLGADRTLVCSPSDPVNMTYAWGIYKDTDAFAPSSAVAPWSNGNSNLWMLHHSGFLLIPGQILCTGGIPGGAPFTYGLNDLQYRRYELSTRKYKRRLDSQNDSLIFGVECAPSPFSTGGELLVTAYFRLLLLE